MADAEYPHDRRDLGLLTQIPTKNRCPPIETELLQWCFDHYGLGAQVDRTCLEALLQAYGCQVESRSTWTAAELRSRLNQFVPLLARSRLTPGYHYVALQGYGPWGWIVYDPWGNATTGYRCLDGDRVIYPLDYWQEMVGEAGAIVAVARR
ncbi:MAG: hypothetical protein HC805_08845 [Alkalinema sp. RL_2_19]|nr:hypothetical protein [Alkalinema sp. RL_2_19]